MTVKKNDYFTIQEVAKKFGVNPTTIYRLARRGKIPAFKVGSQWRFSSEQLNQWIASAGAHSKREKV